MDRFVVLLNLALGIVLALHLAGTFGAPTLPLLLPPPTPAPAVTPSPSSSPVPTPTPSPTPASTPAEEVKGKSIIIDGVINEWSSTALTILDPSEDVSSDATSEKGADLKAVHALMDENYLYVAIQIYGVFDPSLLRNYFIALDFDSDQQDEYHFGVRPDGNTWVFNHTIDKNNWNEESTLGVIAAGDKDTIEIKIPREEYKIPKSVLIYCRVTEGGPTVDSTKWFEVTPTKIHDDPDVKLVPEEIELKYDDGTPDGSSAIGFTPGTGYLVDFSPPSTPFTITNIKVFGNLYGTGYEDLRFTVEIWDKDQKTVHSASYPHTKFTLTPEWVEVEVPEVAVDDSFNVHVFTNSPGEGGIKIGYDSSVENEHSEVTKSGKIDWWINTPKERINWMIRVVGNQATIPSITEEKPAAKEVELKYDAGEIKILTSQRPGWGYSVHFSPPATPFTISKIKVLARLYGTEYADCVASLEIWNEDFDVLYSREMPATEFSEVPHWVTVETNIALDGDFRVVFFPNSGGQEGGISMGYDLSGNEASEVAKAGGTIVDWIESWETGTHPKPRETTNWMIRVVGTPDAQLWEN